MAHLARLGPSSALPRLQQPLEQPQGSPSSRSIVMYSASAWGSAAGGGEVRVAWEAWGAMPASLEASLPTSSVLSPLKASLTRMALPGESLLLTMERCGGQERRWELNKARQPCQRRQRHAGGRRAFCSALP